MRRFLAASIIAAFSMLLISTPADARKRQTAPALGCVVTDRNPCSMFSGPFDRQIAPAQPSRRKFAVRPSHYSGGLGPKPRASCGWYMRAQFGGRYGPEFNRARAWASLPRASLTPGAVVVSARKGRGCGGACGHVVKVVSVIDQCRAVVQDNSGTYTRDTCRARVAVVRP